MEGVNLEHWKAMNNVLMENVNRSKGVAIERPWRVIAEMEQDDIGSHGGGEGQGFAVRWNGLYLEKEDFQALVHQDLVWNEPWESEVS